ncbi:MAG: zinc-dependent peptidase [Saprospiraceae bacterium]|nr:zinc-dependent peptidase [Saprospiraceae bacterium]
MPALVLSVPFFLLAAVLLGLVLGVSERYAPTLVVPTVGLAILYVFSPEINWWWYRRNPPDLPDPLKRLISHSPYYKRLPENLQLRFRQKVALFMMGTDFKKPTDEGGVPEDIKAALAASAVPLILTTETLVFPHFEHVVMYATPFPSPQYPTRMHLSEIYEEDGVVLFSAEHLLKGFLQPEQYFPIGLYEYARIFLRLCEKQHVAVPKSEESIWQSIEAMAGYSHGRIAQWINLEEKDIELPAVIIVHFFMFPERFRALEPGLYEAYCKLFHQ